MKINSIQEAFGDPIGSYAGETLVGVRDERSLTPEITCPECGMIPVDNECECQLEDEDICPECGMLCVDGQCGCQEDVCSECGMMPTEGKCGCMNEAKKGGPSKKTARKILKGTKTFKEKMKKVSGWAEEPAAAAAWMMHKATGKWPSEK